MLCEFPPGFKGFLVDIAGKRLVDSTTGNTFSLTGRPSGYTASLVLPANVTAGREDPPTQGSQQRRWRRCHRRRRHRHCKDPSNPSGPNVPSCTSGLCRTSSPRCTSGPASGWYRRLSAAGSVPPRQPDNLDFFQFELQLGTRQQQTPCTSRQRRTT